MYQKDTFYAFLKHDQIMELKEHDHIMEDGESKELTNSTALK